MPSDDLQKCRACSAWQVTATLPQCPNCGAGTPQSGLFHRRSSEQAALQAIAERADKGLVASGGAGCIYGLFFGVSAIGIFSKFGLKRHWSHESPLHPFFENLLGAAVLAGAAWLLVDWILKATRRARAQRTRSRLNELRDQLHVSSSNLKQRESTARERLQKAKRHLEEIRGALAELPRIKEDQKVEENRRALVDKALEWLVDAQGDMGSLLYVDIRRWQNSFEPLRPDRIASDTPSLDAALRDLESRRKLGTDLLQRLRGTLWPARLEAMADALRRWLAECEELEQIFRKRKMNLTLKVEVPLANLFDGRARSLAIWQENLPKPDIAIEPPGEIRTAFETLQQSGPGGAAWERRSMPWEAEIFEIARLAEYARRPGATKVDES